MIISLDRVIFQKNPDERFAERRKVYKGLLHELYRRHTQLAYDWEELQEYYLIKTKCQIDRKNLWSWIKQVEIYNRAQQAIKMGAKEVNVTFFGPNTAFVIKEITKNQQEIA